MIKLLKINIKNNYLKIIIFCFKRYIQIPNQKSKKHKMIFDLEDTYSFAMNNIDKINEKEFLVKNS